MTTAEWRGADGQADIAAARKLFEEYQTSLGIDLSFQGFAEEVESLPGQYAPPRGRILLAHRQGELAGCVALRPLAEDLAEMKRLFVRPASRGRWIARLLTGALLEEARDAGYSRICLDTLSTMTEALALYRSFGFRETAPYYRNPIPGAVYLALDLRGKLV
jgi:ribosomal protein S18 acetylase RimI-like enzyme